MRMIDRFIPVIRDAFRAAIRDITDRAVLREMIRAIELGDPIRAFRATGFTEAALRPISAAIERAFEAGGILTASGFPNPLATPLGAAVFRFDVRSASAEAWLRTHSSRLVTEMTTEALNGIRNTLTAGMTDGLNPRRVALDIVGRIDPTTGRRVGGIIGLTTGQQTWVARARTELQALDSAYFNRALRDRRFDGIVRQAIKTGQPLTSDQVDRLISRYADRVLAYRGEMIARTEALQSLNQAQYEAYQQAIDMGAISASAISKIWRTAGDGPTPEGRTRHTHWEMEGQRRDFEEAFVSPAGGQMLYPGHIGLDAPAREIINCRCVVEYDVDWTRDVD